MTILGATGNNAKYINGTYRMETPTLYKRGTNAADGQQPNLYFTGENVPGSWKVGNTQAAWDGPLSKVWAHSAADNLPFNTLPHEVEGWFVGFDGAGKTAFARRRLVVQSNEGTGEGKIAAKASAVARKAATVAKAKSAAAQKEGEEGEGGG